ncbi:hypothetical protein BDP27DRAFT_1444448 [Rhodocollybia butyracea]|uniref:Uncharacterized protein n=1 Tax=Rhodocollybia butyracea TaxID=206335 RepID=A0A9P5Q3M0_9AGAR|nr:hypothetical protein BDP27DRAFT_1444448 [Rhodocollybia butyracea]
MEMQGNPPAVSTGPVPSHPNTSCWSICIRCDITPENALHFSSPYAYRELHTWRVSLPMDTHRDASSLAYTEIVLTSIDGKTGDDIPGVFPPAVETGFTNFLKSANLFKEVQGTVVYSYEGLYRPDDPGKREEYHFKMRGVPECDPPNPPCFGWRAKGQLFRVSKGKEEQGEYYKQAYIGISPGPLKYGGFKGTWGRPSYPAYEKLNSWSQTEWQKLLDEFKENFMKHAPNGPVEPPFQPSHVAPHLPIRL